jgi:hypothetical protein
MSSIGKLFDTIPQISCVSLLLRRCADACKECEFDAGELAFCCAKMLMPLC